MYWIPELFPGANQVWLKRLLLAKGAPGWGQGRAHRVMQRRRDEVNGDGQGYTSLTSCTDVPGPQQRSEEMDGFI